MLREEQDRAYRASLEADREKERELKEKLEEEERKRKEEEEEKRRLEEEKESQKRKFELKKNSIPSIPSEGEIVNLAFQLPNGKRLKRPFSASTQIQV